MHRVRSLCCGVSKQVPPTCSPGAKVAHLNLLPQSKPSGTGASTMVREMDANFGSCTNHGECEAACPKEISIDVIALMNADYLKSMFKNRRSLSRR